MIRTAGSAHFVWLWESLHVTTQKNPTCSMTYANGCRLLLWYFFKVKSELCPSTFLEFSKPVQHLRSLLALYSACTSISLPCPFLTLFALNSKHVLAESAWKTFLPHNEQFPDLQTLIIMRCGPMQHYAADSMSLIRWMPLPSPVTHRPPTSC